MSSTLPARATTRAASPTSSSILSLQPLRGRPVLLRGPGWQAAGRLAVSGAAASYIWRCASWMPAARRRSVTCRGPYHRAEAGSRCRRPGEPLRGRLARHPAAVDQRTDRACYVPGSFFVSYLHAGTPKVSILVPTRTGSTCCSPASTACCASRDIRLRGHRGRYDSRETATREYLTALPQRDPRVRDSDPGAFNFAGHGQFRRARRHRRILCC